MPLHTLFQYTDVVGVLVISVLRSMRRVLVGHSNVDLVNYWLVIDVFNVHQNTHLFKMMSVFIVQRMKLLMLLEMIVNVQLDIDLNHLVMRVSISTTRQ